MNGIDRRALLRGLVSLPALIPVTTLPAAAGEPLRPDLNGLGMVYIDGRQVFFDALDYRDVPVGSEALVIAPGNRERPLAVRKTVNYDHFVSSDPRPRHVRIDATQGGAKYGLVYEVPIIGRVVKGGLS